MVILLVGIWCQHVFGLDCQEQVLPLLQGALLLLVEQRWESVYLPQTINSRQELEGINPVEIYLHA